MKTQRKLFVLPLVLALLLLPGCDAGQLSSAATPTEPQLLVGTATLADYKLVHDLLVSNAKVLRASSLIGSGGGEIHLLGHSITVPAGAVQRPTLFALSVLPTGYVEVDLTATLGKADVGSKGFRKPIPVRLSYARASNVSDPGRLTVLRVTSPVGYGSFEVLRSTVNTDEQTVLVELDHFSRYALGYPH